MKLSRIVLMSLAVSMLSVPAFASGYDLNVENDTESREIYLTFTTKKTMSKRCHIPVEKLVVERADMRGSGQIEIKTGPIKGKCMMAFGKSKGMVTLKASRLTSGRYRVLIDGEDNGTVRLSGRLKNAK
jgi:hypothetical protein